MGEPVRFIEEHNAFALKDELEEAGKTVHVQRSAVYDFSETAKEEWFLDYSPD